MTQRQTEINLDKNPFIADIDWDTHREQMLSRMSPERRVEFEKQVAIYMAEIDDECMRYQNALHRRICRTLIAAVTAAAVAARNAWRVERPATTHTPPLNA